jgi:Zn-dependent metalloprotease
MYRQRQRRRAHQQRHPNKVYPNLVDSMGRGAAEQIRYRAQTTCVGPTATFADARAAEEQAAAELGYSASAAGSAWQAQGVTASWQPSC